MKRKWIFVIVGAVCLFALALFLRKPRLVVVDTTPKNGATHNPFLPIRISFNRDITPDEVRITITPEAQLTKTAQNQSLLIAPAFAFDPNTTYSVTVNTSPPLLFSFTTEQQGSNMPGWNEQMEQANREYEAKHGAQDRALISLKSRVPIQEKGFVVDFSYKTNTYTTTLDAPYAQNKSSFLSWIRALGVTDLSTVRITYINKPSP